ncbi:beta-L-arabinofuranosidase domain-containing protein [Streptomyces flaveolus]|uniref:Beta-L-arabinofuranosidase domain-containing protein n=2 Tax=Streptomyces TaxID=1883 RepID=A0ABV3ACM7_9ACTN
MLCVVAGQLSNGTCENCNSYNMLKLTRLLHFGDPDRTDLLDYYERTLFNQMLGEQDRDSAHGFNICYTGLGPGSFKQQPSFMGTDPDAYSTDYDNFSCDHGTGMETHAKFADTVYTHDEQRLLVNLFIPSEVRRQEKGIT